MTIASRNPERSRRAIPWFIYILFCSDKSYYVGIAPNLNKRFQIHNSGLGPQYTQNRLPVKIVYFKKYLNKSEARKREIQLKGWTKKKKELLIKGLYK